MVGVESVRVAGEEVRGGSGPLVPGVAYVTCCGCWGGMFILENTGVEIGFEGEGIVAKWRYSPLLG